QAAVPLDAARHSLDVLLNPGFTAPLFCPCPQVTVFHDLQHRRHPEYFRWFDRPFWQFFLFWSAHVSRLLLTVSDATAVDLVKYYRVPESKVWVTPEGVDAVFFDIGRRRRPEPFLLTVSTLHPHKNLDGLLRAFAGFRPTHPEFRLVVCGLHGFSTGALHDLRDSLGLRDAVDAAIPTACSGIEPLRSIAGGAALEFDPLDAEAIADAMRRITDDEALRARLGEAGPRRAAQFSWRATAEGTLAALVEAGRGRKWVCPLFQLLRCWPTPRSA